MTGTPVREQYMAALETGNRQRIERARLKREIAAGRLNVCDVITDPPAALASMPLIELLIAQHRWGEYRAARALRGIWDPAACAPLMIAEQRKLSELTDRQRRLLCTALTSGRPC
jgi:hypothetical protein